MGSAVRTQVIAAETELGQHLCDRNFGFPLGSGGHGGLSQWWIASTNTASNPEEILHS